MDILGISAYYHDSAAALLRDGQLIAAVQEERFSRKKHDARFPVNAIGYCLAEAKTKLDAVDYVVFYDNHRGSSGYGEEFGLLLEGKYSSPDDAADHLSGVDAMIAKGFIDPENLFVTGGSAGGIATAYLVGLTDRFNAAVAAKPVINWLSKPLTADSYIFQIRHQFPTTNCFQGLANKVLYRHDRF